MVPHEGPGATLQHDVEALTGIGAISERIAEANDALDVAPIDIVHHDTQGIEIPVDIGDERDLHGVRPPGFELWESCPDSSTKR